MQIDPWKFAFGPAITGLVFLLYKSNKFLVGKSLLLIFLVLVSTYLGSRSLALFTVLALIITIRKVSIRKTTLAGGIGIGLVFLTLLFGFELDEIYFHLKPSLSYFDLVRRQYRLNVRFMRVSNLGGSILFFVG